MGLDMYLSTNSKKVCKAANQAGGGDAFHVHYGTAIYWRKANAIHRWFVENVQNGEDDCRSYEVEVVKLMELRDVCKRVLEHPSKAARLLPTQEGFFFGGTEYDDYYFDELKRTVTALEAILDNVEEYEYRMFEDFSLKDWREKGEEDDWSVRFHYQSSW